MPFFQTVAHTLDANLTPTGRGWCNSSSINQWRNLQQYYEANRKNKNRTATARSNAKLTPAQRKQKQKKKTQTKCLPTNHIFPF